MEKRIELKNGDIIIFRKTQGYSCYTISIDRAVLLNGKLIKTFTFSMWDDFGFNATCVNDEKYTKKIDFDITKDDPLYKHFLDLLDNNDKLIIDDDDTLEENKKTITIYKCDNKIKILFKNEINEELKMKKFYIFIKNIMYDGRSKIDRNGCNTKERLINFFRCIDKEFLCEDKNKKYYK